MIKEKKQMLYLILLTIVFAIASIAFVNYGLGSLYSPNSTTKFFPIFLVAWLLVVFTLFIYLAKTWFTLICHFLGTFFGID